MRLPIIFGMVCLACLQNAIAEEAGKAVSLSSEVTWVTDRPATSQVEYWEEGAGLPHSFTPPDANFVTEHKVKVGLLKPSTVYRYRIRCRDASGQEIISAEHSLFARDPGLGPAIEISEVKAENLAADDAPAPIEQEAGKPKAQESPAPIPSQIIKEPAIEETLIEKGGLLLKRNTLQIEPSFTYAHVSTNKITIDGIAVLPILIVGTINNENVKKDIFIPAFSARYGLLDCLQWNVKVPYRAEHDRVSNSNNTESIRQAQGIGDIETGLFYQLMYERGALPGLIAGINVKSDTGQNPYENTIGLGTGHWGVKGSLVWVKTSDPAIFFGSLGYTANLERDISGFGKVNPGDTFDYSLGLAFALNYQAALNLQLEQAITTSSQLNDTRVPGSFTNAAVFKAGITYSFSKNFSCDAVVGYGLSEDAPDVTLEIRFPYTF